MTARRRRYLAVTVCLATFCCASPTDARAQGGDDKKISAALHVDGKAVSAKQFLLYTSTRIAEAKRADGNTVTFEQEEVPDRTPVTVFVDEYDDGSRNVLLVQDGALPPPEEPNALRRRLGALVLRHDSKIIVDIGKKTVTDAAHEESAQVPQPTGERPIRIFISGNLGLSSTVNSTDFCGANSVLLGNIGADLVGCDYKGEALSVTGTGGVIVTNVIGNLDLVAAGGYGNFADTSPQVQGLRQPNLNIERLATEVITGGVAALGVHLTRGRWYVQPVAGVARLTRKTSTSDTFRQGAQSSTNRSDRRDRDVQPYVAAEVGVRIFGFLFTGFEYRYTRFTDPQKTQNLHGASAVLRVQR